MDEVHAKLLKWIENGEFNVEDTEDPECKLIHVGPGAKPFVTIKTWGYTYTIHIMWYWATEVVKYDQELAWKSGKVFERTVWR